MMPMPWIKLHVEIIDDAKLRHFTPEQCWFFVCMLCLARGGKPPGVVALGADAIAWRLHRDQEWVDDGLRACIDAGLVGAEARGFVLPKFIERQAPRKPEKPGAVAGRMRAHRAKKRRAA